MYIFASIKDGMTKDTTLTPKKGIGKVRNGSENSLQHRIIGCEVLIIFFSTHNTHNTYFLKIIIGYMWSYIWYVYIYGR